MDRRSFLAGTAVGAGAVGAAAGVSVVIGKSDAPTPADSGEITQQPNDRTTSSGDAARENVSAPAVSRGIVGLTMMSSWPDGGVVLDDAASKFVEMVTAISDGTLVIEKNTPGPSVSGLDVFDAVSSGDADLYHSAEYYFLGHHPAYVYFSAVPFGATAQELTNWYHHGGGQTLHDELSHPFNIKPFLVGNTGSQSGGWFRNEIRSPEDFRGLKVRVPGLGGQVLEKLGATIQNVASDRMFRALSNGALDGLEWLGPYADEGAGFHRAVNNYYMAGFHEPGTGLSSGVNLDVFNSLTPHHRAVLETAAMATTHWHLAQTQFNNGAALARIQASDVQILQFPDTVWDAFGVATAELLDENMDDPLFERIRTSFEASLMSSTGWIEKSDGYFIRQRNRVLGWSKV